MSITEYINEYKNKTFEEEQFNEIDNVILSILSYLDFDGLTNKDTRISTIGKKLLKQNTLKKISSLGMPQRDAYKCLTQLINTKRYGNIQILDYIYLGTNEEQFSAVTFKIKKDLLYVAFEGTDNLMSGWKEDFQLAYMYPIPAQIHATKYLNKTIKYFGPKIIVGGHSKGGNLALTSSIEMNILKQKKIKKIYNNDGPGLRKKEFNSKKYIRIKNKYIHIVPQNSIIGIMLRNENYKVIKSKRKTILSHYPTSWIVGKDKFIETQFKPKNKKLEKNILEWLDNHNDLQRKIMIDNVFKIFERCEIKDTRNLREIKNIKKIIEGVKNIDKETKELTLDFIRQSILNKNKNLKNE